MGIIKNVPTLDGPFFCICFPPLWFTVGIGTVWQCDTCGRTYERRDDVAHSTRWFRVDLSAVEPDTTPTEYVDPDCRDSKHTACPGWTLNTDTDASTPCECPCHDPGGPTP